VSDEFEKDFVSVDCPVCGYPFEIQIIDARLGARVYCPNCKVSIQLVGDDLERTRHEVDSAFEDLANTLKRMGG
jgi:uncharacterized Zn finger protein (UPF0148 family)